MELNEIVAWIVFGGLAGWIASLIVGKNSHMGLAANILTGIGGAFVGGVLFPNDADTFDVGSFIAAVVGAIILLFVINMIAGRRTTL